MQIRNYIFEMPMALYLIRRHLQAVRFVSKPDSEDAVKIFALRLCATEIRFRIEILFETKYLSFYIFRLNLTVRKKYFIVLTRRCSDFNYVRVTTHTRFLHRIVLGHRYSNAFIYYFKCRYPIPIYSEQPQTVFYEFRCNGKILLRNRIVQVYLCIVSFHNQRTPTTRRTY